MSEFNYADHQGVSEAFGQEFNRYEKQDFTYDVPNLDTNSFSRQEVFQYDDPLRYANQYKFPPLVIDLDNSHFVKPHHVDGYTRQDGTAVKGYYRDGDGDTDIDRGLGEGGGYIRGNPDRDSI